MKDFRFPSPGDILSFPGMGICMIHSCDYEGKISSRMTEKFFIHCPWVIVEQKGEHAQLLPAVSGSYTPIGFQKFLMQFRAKWIKRHP